MPSLFPLSSQSHLVLRLHIPYLPPTYHHPGVSCRFHTHISCGLHDSCRASLTGISKPSAVVRTPPFASPEEVQFSSVTQLCPTLRPHGLQNARIPCPSLFPGVSQTHVHRVGDAIQPSHPVSSPSPPALSPSQHQNLFQ